MEAKIENKVYASPDDLLFIFGSALRYGLGRQTYATSLIPGVICDNLSLLNEKWIINLITDIIYYEKDRITRGYKDAECDYESWMNLKTNLIDEYNKRGFEHPIEYYIARIKP